MKNMKNNKKVLEECYKTEKSNKLKTNNNNNTNNTRKIRQINNEYRQTDKATDVLSFPMFEKTELDEKIKNKNFYMKMY